MARRYLVETLPAPGRAELVGPTAHHLAQVMRVRPGEQVVLFDGKGAECSATVLAATRASVRVEAGEARACGREPDLRLELAVALPKGARAEWLFEHGTEVGIAAFRPVIAERSHERGGTRAERWRRIVAAAATQCDRARIPTVHEPVTLTELLATPGLPSQRFLGAFDGTAPPRGLRGGALLLVGPEGGFTPEEEALARAAGCVGVHFSPLTWRTETAAVVGAALLLAP